MGLYRYLLDILIYGTMGVLCNGLSVRRVRLMLCRCGGQYP